MNGTDQTVVQVVMKNADGSSILTQEALRAGAGDVSAARAEEIRAKLKALGLEVLEGNLNTLSVAGTSDQLEAIFGLTQAAAAIGIEAHAAHISKDLEPFVADVFIPQPPEFFR